MIYQRGLLKSQNSGDPTPPQVLNPLIRGLRLAFILLFTAFDIGQALYMVIIYYFFFATNQQRENISLSRIRPIPDPLLS